VFFVRLVGHLIGGNITFHALFQDVPLFVSFRSKLCVTISDCLFESWVPLGEWFCNFLYILITDICCAVLDLCSCSPRVCAPAAVAIRIPHAEQLNVTLYISSLDRMLYLLYILYFVDRASRYRFLEISTAPHGSPRIQATRSAATTPGMIFMDFKFSF